MSAKHHTKPIGHDVLMGTPGEPWDHTQIQPTKRERSYISAAFKEGFEAGLMDPGWKTPCCPYPPSDHNNEPEWCQGYDEGERQRIAAQKQDASIASLVNQEIKTLGNMLTATQLPDDSDRFASIVSRLIVLYAKMFPEGVCDKQAYSAKPDFTEVLKRMQHMLSAHPWWNKRIDGTPLATDLPVRAAIECCEICREISHNGNVISTRARSER